MAASSPSGASADTRDGSGPVTIVVGVDGTEPSFRALAYATGVAQHINARVICAYVRHASPNPAVCLAAVGAEVALQAAADVASSTEAVLKASIASARHETGIDITLRVLDGDPALVIERLANDLKADLVVIGAPRHPAMHVLTSITRRLHRKPHQPVTTVP
jgi:nucleotide-binding universal stress UspA family protein